MNKARRTKIVAFIRNHWVRAILSSALITWTAITAAWIVMSGAPLYVMTHAVYDLAIEGFMAVSLWLDVILKKFPGSSQ